MGRHMVIYKNDRKMDGQTDRWIDREWVGIWTDGKGHTERWTDKRTYELKDRYRKMEKDIQTDGLTDRWIVIGTNIWSNTER
jgi:hypothetical protein